MVLTLEMGISRHWDDRFYRYYHLARPVLSADLWKSHVFQLLLKIFTT